MKKKRIKTGIIAALSGIVVLPGCDSMSNTGSPSEEQSGTNDQHADSLRLEKRLKELSQTKYAGELAMGAMCYDPAIPMYADYVCPYCNDTVKEKYNGWMIYNINNIEEIVNQIKAKGYDVVLDKTEFCPHCNKKSIEYPELIFKFRFSAQADYHVSKSNINYEYCCLLAFLSNQDTFTNEYDYEYALHDNIAIIQKMTGLGKDLEMKK